MERSLTQRLLSPIVELRRGEEGLALVMFGYAFLVMTAYNIIQPLTRSKLIFDLGADNIPYVLIVAAVVIGAIMLAYSRVVSGLPRRWALTIVQAGMAAVMVTFWTLFQTQQQWVSVAFYLWGQILGILLISQFWTLANGIYDPRQAKRLFGFIGGGVAIGGATGAAITTFLIETLGTNTLLLISAAVLVACAVMVGAIQGAQGAEVSAAEAGGEEKGVGLTRAMELLKGSRQIQLIALVIGFGSLGAALIDQQVNMAAEEFRGPGGEDSIGAFLGAVRLYLSIAAFVIQVWLTPRIHKYLGVGFALMMLPFGLSSTAVAIILLRNLWAPATATILDRAVRYTVDKTTREVLFLPLPSELRQEVKPFVDVTVDRLSRGVAGALMLLLIKDWGLALQWHQLSYISLILAVFWFVLASRAKREYLASFRRSIERRDVQAAEVRLDVADLATVETLIEELASPDERRVLYAIEILESLDKRNLITPLLLYHESAAVRTRALQALGAAPPATAERWLPSIQRMVGDGSAEVRAAAVMVLANVRNEQVTELIRPYLTDRDPRIATTAAVVLSGSGRQADVESAEELLSRLAADTRDVAADGRREVAAAIGQIRDSRFRHLLIPLLYDAHPAVAEEAMRTVTQLGSAEFLFVPTLVSLLRNRQLKSSARDVLVSYGEEVLDALNHFLRDPEEDIWVRRHIPATIARIPSQKSMDLLVAALAEPDGFLRYKLVTAIGRLRREHDALTFNREPIEALLMKESLRYYTYLTLHFNLFVRERLPGDVLLAKALEEKIGRTLDRIYRLLALLYPWNDVAAARWAIEHGDSRARASALEYLDNLLTGTVKKRLMPLLEHMPLEEKVRKANVVLKSRPRDAEETLLQLINDDDEVVSAAAIDLVEERKVWTLVDDIEHVLAYRDARDWAVFEAASWALAAHRMPDARRRELWIEPLPAVQLAGRLRPVPLFQSVSVDELFRIAATGRQVRYEAGRVLYQEGMAPDQVQFLLDGSVAAKRHADQDASEQRPPAYFGLEEILEGSAMPATLRTADSSVCLVCTGDEMRTLLSDNTDLVQGLFRMLAGRMGRDRLVMKGKAVAPSAEGGELKPIERVFVLEGIPVFAGLAADELLTLASIARPVALRQGAALFGEGDAASIYAVLSGRVTIEAAGGPSRLTAGPGDAIGVLETLAGGSIGHRGAVAEAGQALRIDREDLFDLLGQRPALLEQLFGALFRTPIEAPAA